MRSIFKRAITRLMARRRAYDLIPPYDYVQNVVEFYLADYLRVAPSAVSVIYIVGGHLGHEIPRLLGANPSCKITVFEPSPRYSGALSRRYAGNPRVRVESYAVADKAGETTFHETSLKGSGSLLPLGSLAMISYQAKQAESFAVQCVTLDQFAAGTCIDCLWIDVQGAERLVLQGAVQSLRNTKSVFIEVSVFPDLYQGSATMAEIDTFLRDQGFQIALLGLDKGNLTGNAFYVRA